MGKGLVSDVVVMIVEFEREVERCAGPCAKRLRGCGVAMFDARIGVMMRRETVRGRRAGCGHVDFKYLDRCSGIAV